MDHKVDEKASLSNRFAALETHKESSPLTEVPTTSKSWMQIHCEMGHISDQAMRRSLGGGNVPAAPKELCQECARGKARHPNVKRAATRSSVLGDSVSIDIQGPFRLPTVEGARLKYQNYRACQQMA